MEKRTSSKPLNLRLTWVRGIYVLFILLALVTRLWALGDRVQSHDESIHALYSWNLYSGRGFQHHPLMHGPLMFHVTALFYFLFGDNDFVARTPVALIGVAIVAFPYFLRRWLGRAGAIATSFFLLISPAIAYYSRYFRHDIPTVLWSLIVVLSVFSYLHDGRVRWLYLLAAGVSLMFATKEVSFIYSAIFGLFLVGLTGIQATPREWALEKLKPIFLVALATAAVGLLIVGAGLWAKREAPSPAWWAISGGLLAGLGMLTAIVLLILGQLKTEDLNLPPFVVTLALIAAVAGLLFALGLPALFRILSGTQPALQEYEIPTRVRLVLTVLPIAIGISIILAWFALKAFRAYRTFDLVVVLGTLCLPFLSPAIIKLVAGLDPMDYNAPTLYYSFAILIEVLFLSIAIGLMWDRQRREENGAGPYTWLIAATIHYAIFLVFFTTFFTNGYGIASGLIGSLGYWLEQQGVQRGGQPWYYYIITVLFYEFLPLLLTLIAVVYLIIRSSLPRRVTQPVTDLPITNLPTTNLPTTDLPFIPFLLWWIATSWVGYSYAGEKMPWLTTHVTLPMILLSGWLVGRLIEWIDWREAMRRRAWLLALSTPPFVMAVAMLIQAASLGPFQGYGLAQLHTSGQFVGALLGVLILGSVLGYLIWRGGLRIAAPILALVALLIPVGLTIRTTERFCYVTDEYPTEFLVYAHAAPGVSEAMRQVEELSRRVTGSPHDIEVAYGEDGSTLWYWQLRNYTNARFFGTQPSREQMDAPVIIAGRDQWDAVAPYIGNNYYYNTYTYLWWPMQDYFNLKKARGFLGLDWQKIRDVIRNPQMIRALWRIWYDRDYRLYEQVTSRTYTLDQWPLRADFRLYIRRDVAARIWERATTEPAENLEPGEGTEAISPVDRYAAGWRDLAARLVFGSAGTGWSQFQGPRGIKVGPDGFVYVADAGNHRIQKFTADGQFVASFGTLSTLDGERQGPPRGFLEPWDVAVAPDGSLYVADTWNHRIQHLDPNGNLIHYWGLFGQYGIGDLAGRGAFYGPRGIVVGKNGNIYVADTGNKRIQVFTPDGQFLYQWGGGGVLEGYLDEPVGIAISAAGEVYVADTWNRRVQVFDANGGFLRQWPIAGWDTGDPEEKPYLAVDSAGYVYVTDPARYRVLVFDEMGNYVLSFGKLGTDERSFGMPMGIAVAPDGSIYVTDAHNSRVMVFDPLDLDGGAAVAPALLSPGAGAEVMAGTVSFAGTGAPLTSIRILVDGESIGIAQTNDEGAWVYTADLEEPGVRLIVLEALNTRGEVVSASTPITLTVVGAPVATVITPTLDLPEGAQLPSGGVTLSGSGGPGSTVEILYDGIVTGTAEVGRDGRWVFVFVPAAGEHRLAVRPSGVLTPSAVVSATVAESACSSPPGACVGETYVVAPGDPTVLEELLDCISRCTGVSPDDLLAANPEIVPPRRIEPGQILRIPR